MIVPLAVWRSQRDALLDRAGGLGVWLDANDDPALIAGDLGHFAVIAVNFPQFTDGRGYSIGRLLRERYGWRGELRAVGDVLRDQLFYLTRCGFDAFVSPRWGGCKRGIGCLRRFQRGLSGVGRAAAAAVSPARRGCARGDEELIR